MALDDLNNSQINLVQIIFTLIHAFFLKKILQYSWDFYKQRYSKNDTIFKSTENESRESENNTNISKISRKQCLKDSRGSTNSYLVINSLVSQVNSTSKYILTTQVNNRENQYIQPQIDLLTTPIRSKSLVFKKITKHNKLRCVSLSRSRYSPKTQVLLPSHNTNKKDIHFNYDSILEKNIQAISSTINTNNNPIKYFIQEFNRSKILKCDSDIHQSSSLQSITGSRSDLNNSDKAVRSKKVNNYHRDLYDDRAYLRFCARDAHLVISELLVSNLITDSNYQFPKEHINKEDDVSAMVINIKELFNTLLNYHLEKVLTLKLSSTPNPLSNPKVNSALKSLKTPVEIVTLNENFGIRAKNISASYLLNVSDSDITLYNTYNHARSIAIKVLSLAQEAHNDCSSLKWCMMIDNQDNKNLNSLRKPQYKNSITMRFAYDHLENLKTKNCLYKHSEINDKICRTQSIKSSKQLYSHPTPWFEFNSHINKPGLSQNMNLKSGLRLEEKNYDELFCNHKYIYFSNLYFKPRYKRTKKNINIYKLNIDHKQNKENILNSNLCDKKLKFLKDNSKRMNFRTQKLSNFIESDSISKNILTSVNLSDNIQKFEKYEKLLQNEDRDISFKKNISKNRNYQNDHISFVENPCLDYENNHILYFAQDDLIKNYRMVSKALPFANELPLIVELMWIRRDFPGEWPMSDQSSVSSSYSSDQEKVDNDDWVDLTIQQGQKKMYDQPPTTIF